MAKDTLRPGMLTYDDGRSYKEQCRDIIGNADRASKEMIVDKSSAEQLLHSTAIEQFSELGKAIQQMGTVSAGDLAKAVQRFGEALNAVPPYAEPARPISIFRIIRIVCEIMAVASMMAILIKWMV